jgi:hypothetical protein
MNDALFAVLVWIGIGMTVALQWKPMRSLSAAQRWIFVSLAVMSAGMYVLYWLGLKWPMPARIVSEYVAPYVERIVKGGS